MASLQTRLSDLITAIGTDYKTIVGRIGTLASLTTTEKTNLVGALNEVKAAIPASGAVINDASATNATTSTYSANKINAAIAAGLSSLVNGAGSALDTLAELATALGNDANFATTIANALAKRLRVDAAQSFTGPELAQGQANLSVYSQAQLGDPDTNLVTLYTAAKA